MTKPLPTTIWVADPDGKVLEQEVAYEWTPPFCNKCNKVGHDCEKKVTKQWVLKKPQADAQLKGGGKDPVTSPVPPVPPVTQTPVPVVPQVHSDDDSGWKVVTRKSKDKVNR